MVHASVLGYESGAGAYVQGRPGYPREAMDWLRDVLHVGQGRTTLEVGAGTGKFIPMLIDCGGTIVAVEPIDNMRARLAQAFPRVEALRGTAEHIPLRDASVDAIVCAQAFHWFATRAALREMRRVLKPGGMLGLIWNVRDESVDWVAALSEITNRYESDAPRYRTGAWRNVFPAEGFEAIDERHARNTHVGTPEQVIVDRTLSVSFIAALPVEQRAQVANEVRALISNTPALTNATQIAFPYETSMFAFRKTG